MIFKSTFFILILSFLYIPKQETCTLTIHVDHLRSSKGIVQFALYDQDGSIPDEDFTKYYKLLKAKIINGSSTIIFNDIPIGKYAINIFHDENLNGKIDKGFILPIEGIGFSNFQTIGFTNRPNFEKASFIMDKDKIIQVKIIYL